jgi:hypothetical protein
MNLIKAATLTAAIFGWGTAASAAYLYAFSDQSGNAFAYVAPDAITSGASVTPQYCTSASCGVFFNTSPTNFAFFYGSSLNDAVDFPAGAFTAPGFYTAPAVGGRLTVAALPEYATGSYLYSFSDQDGNAFAYVAPDAITSGASVTPQYCTSASCGVLFNTSPTNFVFFYGSSLNDAVDFPAGAFTSPGFYTAPAVGGRLTVAALPDELGSSPPATVPEPGSWFTMILGLGVMSIALRRSTARQSAKN